MSDNEEPRLFDAPATWEEHWVDMPDFEQKNAKEHSSIRVYFRTEEDRKAFFAKIEVPNPFRTRGIWYPWKPYRRWEENAPGVRAGRYPIYIISKGRADSRLTSKALEKLGLDYRIAVEPQEYDQYAAVIDPAKILTLPFSNLGQGSIPARNFVWDHAVSTGARRHWILDDNIGEFARLHQNENRIIWDENPFVACEDFTDRYTNVALSGLQYRFFASYKSELPPFVLNTRIYSCILINHELPFRWRGRYNEDTDLSLRALKAGWCTVLFNAYLCGKKASMYMTGGNTDELYVDDGRLQMAQSLAEQHPDCVIVSEKWGRPQHHVDYSRFKFNKLIRVEGAEEENEDGGRSSGVNAGRVGLAVGGSNGVSSSSLDASGGEGDRASEGGGARSGGEGAESVNGDAVAFPDGSSETGRTAAVDSPNGLF